MSPRLRAHAGHFAMLLLAACGGPAIPGDANQAPPIRAPMTPHAPVATTPLTFAGFSAAREAFQTRLLPTFAQQWHRSHGARLALDTHFLGNEALVDGLAGALRSDVVVLSSTRDLDALVAAGLAEPAWNQRPYGGIVCRTLVVLAVRRGNPKGIRNWADLARPDVRVVGSDPATSGCGVWTICALHGAALRGHAGVAAGDPAAARDFVARVRSHFVANGSNAHEAFLQFLGGLGDVAVTYESELGYAWMFGHDVERVVPTSTVLVESPALRIRNDDGDRERAAAADALLAFLWSREAQQVLANCGLRPVDPAVAGSRAEQFPLPQDLWTIEQLGGWQHFAGEVLPSLGGTATPGK